MTFRTLIAAAAFAAVSLLVAAPVALAQDRATAEEMLATAEAAYERAEDAEGAEKFGLYEAVRRTLDDIVDEHPASDISVQILLGREVAGIDIQALDSYLEENRAEMTAVVIGRSAEAEAIFDSAAALYAETANAEPERKFRLMRSIRALLDRIVDDYPASDLAVRILLGGEVGPIDVDEVDRVLAENGEARPPEAAATARRPDPGAGSGTGSGAGAGGQAAAADDDYRPQASYSDGRRAERALGLNFRQRSEVQRRLALIGFYSRRIDGVFGRGTRSAIAEWQFRAGYPETGYLDRRQLLHLMDDTEEIYQDWLRRNAASSRGGRYIGSDGCLREADGRIVGNQSLRCDTRGLGQALGL